MAKSVGLRLGEPLDISQGINYFPLTASDHQCKDLGGAMVSPFAKRLQVGRRSLEVFLGNGSCSWWVSHK